MFDCSSLDLPVPLSFLLTRMHALPAVRMISAPTLSLWFSEARNLLHSQLYHKKPLGSRARSNQRRRGDERGERPRRRNARVKGKWEIEEEKREEKRKKKPSGLGS